MFLISNTIIFLARKIPFFNWPCRLVVMGRPHIIKAMSLVMIRFQMSMSAPRLCAATTGEERKTEDGWSKWVEENSHSYNSL